MATRGPVAWSASARTIERAQTYRRWRARYVAELLLVTAAIGLAAMPAREDGSAALLDCVAVLLACRFLARMQRARQLLVQMDLVAPYSAGRQAALYALRDQAGFDAKLEACLEAVTAETDLELEPERALSELDALRDRGWKAPALISGWTGSVACVVDAASFMACAQAAGGELTEAEELIGRLHDRRIEGASTLLLRAVVAIQRREPTQALSELDKLRRHPEGVMPRYKQLEVVLRSFVASARGAAYRSTNPSGSNKSVRWLALHWPALRTFVEQLDG